MPADERRFEKIVEYSVNGIVLIDRSGLILYESPSSARILGHTLEGMDITDISTRIHPEDQAPVRRQLDQVLETPDESIIGQFRYKHQHETWRWIEGIAYNKLDEPDVAAIILNFRDITDRKEIRDTLDQTNEKLIEHIHSIQRRTREMTLLTEMSEILRTCLSLDEAYKVVAQYSTQLFPIESGALYILNSEYDILEVSTTWGTITAQQDFGRDHCWGLRRGQGHLMETKQGNIFCQHMEEPYPERALCIPMMAHGDMIGIYHLLLEEDKGDSQNLSTDMWKRLATAVAEQTGLTLANLKLLESLSNQAVRDPLTTLFNRRYMEESLARELHRAKRNKHPLGIIMIDLDYLKKYNDEYGHEAGNVLLSTLGHYLRSQIRGEDIACRYGGDEFTLILPTAALEIMRQRAEKILNNVVELPVHFHGKTIGTVSISAGIAMYPDDSTTSEELIEAADRAMYYAKATGKNKLAIYSEIPEGERKLGNQEIGKLGNNNT